MNLLLILLLTLLNGLFAMSEMALAASRKARLDALAAAQKPGASAALPEGPWPVASMRPGLPSDRS